MILFVIIIRKSPPNTHHFPQPCAKLAYLFKDNSTALSGLHARYPICANLAPGVAETTYAAVTASLSHDFLEERVAAFNMIFGISGWLGFVVNVFFCELYLNKTKGEDERLKKVSLMKRRAAELEKALEKNE